MEKIEDILSRIDSHQKKQTKRELKRYLKNWPLFLSFILVFSALGVLKYKLSPNIYEVKSRILVTEENKNLNSILSSDNMMLARGNTNIENKIGILRSYTLFKKALMNLNWETSWFQKELFYKRDLYRNVPFSLILPPNAINAQDVLLEIEVTDDKKFHLKAKGQTNQNGYAQTINIDEYVEFGKPYVNEFFNFTLINTLGGIGETYYLNFNNLNSLTQSYLKRTEIDMDDPNSDLISIVIQGTAIQKEVDFINELNNVFIRFGVENKNISSDNSITFIDNQLSRIKTQLNSAEDNFSTYRRSKNIINLSQEAQLVYQKLEEIDEEKYMTQLQLDYYKDLEQYLDNSEEISKMVNPSVIGITDDNLNQMLSKLMNLYSRREILAYSVKEKSPSFKMLENEIMITRDGLEETIKNQLKATESILESTEARYRQIEARIKDLPETEKELIGIQREFDLNNELYTYLLQKRAEASISKASIAPEIQVIDPPLVEASLLVGPNLIKTLAFALLAGLIIPFVIVILINFFNTKIESKDEIEKISKIPILEGITKHKYKVLLPVIHHPRSGIAESFRGVKSDLNTFYKETGTRIISINSLLPGEGKSFVASNLSATLARSNKKTLLIGADLHKPTLHKFFNIEEQIGLSNYLENQHQYEEIITETSVPNLYLIQAGPIPANPSELLDNDRLKRLIESIYRKFEFIIIDNAPLMLVPNAISISDLADVSLFMLRINHSYKDQIHQINRIVEFNKIKHAAVLINGTRDWGYGYGKKYWKKGYGSYRNKMSIA
ncbi:polysaccharide biosynthesis tyrosine autokinase [Draconibacterium orientale]|uniref:GumC family protein n=1 Tax=Draconibacterium orientale TaxID=1168034 RepID=UPI002ABDEAD7|nr:polysaccharide biosynthesis tyrosine autokinase [Draconibacterium orientale]